MLGLGETYVNYEYTYIYEEVNLLLEDRIKIYVHLCFAMPQKRLY